MLTPEQIEALRDVAGKIADPVNEFLIKDIARRISKAGQLTGSAQYQIWRAQNLGLSQKEIKKQVQVLLDVSAKEVRNLMRQSAAVGYRFDLKSLPTAKAIPFEKNTAVQQIVQAIVDVAGEELKNLTRTLGMIDPYGKPLPLQDVYHSCCDFAFLQVSTGASDYNSAIRRATEKIAKYGVQTIDYQSGVHTSLEAAVRRNIMGGLGLMQEQISQRNHDDMGADGWEISAHAASAPDHELIQGKQYSDNEFRELNEKLERRIGTLNCGHAAFPIILGVSQPQYTEEELQRFRKDNKSGVAFQGRHYTVYEATQRQRAIERAIRKKKRQILADEAAENTDDLLNDRIRLERLKQEYSRFSRATGLRTQNERARALGFDKEQAWRAKSEAETYFHYWSKEIGVNESIKSLEKYYDVKYNDSARYNLLKQYAKDVERGWISPLSGFENYETAYLRIQNEIVGKVTSGGITITGQSKHFIQRVIGTGVDPLKLKEDLRVISRSGVAIEDIKDALFAPENIGERIEKSNGMYSVRYVGKNCWVSINPDTGVLIQTNPKKGN